MHIIICLDDRNGMLFNGRRLSSDRTLCKRLLEIADGMPLRMNKYSAKLFENDGILVCDDFLSSAKTGDVCFVENVDFLPYIDRVHTITVCRWNRVYPSDTKFPIERLKDWVFSVVCEYVGNSHKRITEERYTR